MQLPAPVELGLKLFTDAEMQLIYSRLVTSFDYAQVRYIAYASLMKHSHLLVPC